LQNNEKNAIKQTTKNYFFSLLVITLWLNSDQLMFIM